MRIARRALLAAPCLLAGCRRERPAAPDAAPGVDWSRLVESTPVAGNLLPNGGFEDGLAPWYVPEAPGWEPGVVSAAVVRSGGKSLHCGLRAAAGTKEQRRWGAMYAVGTVPFPRHASLHYRVERWEPGNALQYLLFAVLVGSGGQTYQLRYLLAGPAAVPYNDKGNVRFTLVKKGPPAVGAWVPFATDLYRDFSERWGRVPRTFEVLRFAVETRFEPLAGALDRAIAADVYFDDVHIGYGPPPR